MNSSEAYVERATNAKIISIFDEVQSVVNSTDNILAAAELCLRASSHAKCGCEPDIDSLAANEHNYLFIKWAD